MTLLFCVRPTRPNIGNEVIYRATSDLLHSVFGPDTSIVVVPALSAGGLGGLTASQVYDMNRLADGVVVGGGNLFENGELTLNPRAVDCLQVPMMLIGLSHGRIYGRDGELMDRTDSMPPEAIERLGRKASVTMVRDRASKRMLDDLGLDDVQMAGCPSMFMTPPPSRAAHDGRILVSIRHPSRMCVPPQVQWRVMDDLRRLLAALKQAHGDTVHLLCHDYQDLDFANAFPDTPRLYFDDVDRYLEALKTCRFNVTYRLHAFLPCLALGSASIHLSYDERGREMVATAGMGEWDIDMLRESDLTGAVMRRIASLDRYYELRAAAQAGIAQMQATTLAGLRRFADEVYRRQSLNLRNF
jgi:polysaccharide pyruvyl transferase WcaK-like protein